LPEALQKNHIGLLTTAGKSALRLQEHTRAEELLNAALEANPAHPEPHLLLGDLFAAAHPQKALDGYCRYHELSPPALLATKTFLKRVRELVQSRQTDLNLKELAIAFIGNFTLEPLQGYVEAECFKIGVNAKCYFGGFDQYFQEMADAKSGLHRHQPALTFLLLERRAFAPDLFGDFFSLPADERRRLADHALEQLKSLAEKYLSTSPSRLVIANFPMPREYLMGIHDAQEPWGERDILARMNQTLYDFARSQPQRTFVLDLEKALANRGKDTAANEKMRYLAKMEVPESALPGLAREVARFVRPAAGLTKKCLVLDLDNTLWGGILGEDGIEGIQLGQEPPGNVFREFQKTIRALHHRGILLAINSKNDWALVKEVFEQHPDMQLKADDFACIRANWQDKAQNMREIAKQLNIGLDSLVYMDDNPAERFLIQNELPEILTVDMPADYAEFTQTLLRLNAFETLHLTEEDRQRKQLYQAETKRKELQLQVTDLHDYLEALHIQVDIRPADAFAVPRVAQLTQRTNQFNLTTRRYSEAEIKGFLDSGHSRVYYLKSADRFGDHGITGVCIAHQRPGVWEIDSFMMSCRIIGRGIEQAFLHFICKEAEATAGKLIGRYIPSKKNQLVAKFYAEANFTPVSNTESESVYELDLKKSIVALPKHIHLNANHGS
jgi:FkbH-like protein